MSESSRQCDPDRASQQRLIMLLNEAKYDQALKLSHSMINRFSESSFMHNAQGAIYQSLGQFEQAIKSFDIAVKINPDYAEYFFNMGNAQKESGRLDDAISSYQKSVSLDRGLFQAHTNLGVVYFIMGDIDSACDCYRNALAISPNYSIAHNNLGCSLMASEQYTSAIQSFERAMASNPDYIDAIFNLGVANQETGRDKEAISSFEKVISLDKTHLSATIKLANLYFQYKNFDLARKLFLLVTKHLKRDDKERFKYGEMEGKAVECLLQMGRLGEFNKELKILALSNDINIRIASLSAYASEKFSQPDIYPFCRTPLKYVSHGRLENYETDSQVFIDSLIKEMDAIKAVWEPRGKATRGGFQTEGSLFKSPSKLMSRLASIIRQELARYYSDYEHENCNLIHLWPKEEQISGWYVNTGRQGFQDYHIHPSGWVSGVIYLKTVTAPESSEGALKLSCIEGLIEHHDPRFDEHYASDGVVFQPDDGDIIIFPSSIPHRTLPVLQDTNRCVIAFDLHHPLSQPDN